MVSRWMFLVIALALATSAHGAQGLFDARVAVEDQSAQARNEGVREGLTAVLARLTGQSDPGEHEGLRELLGNASRYVQQYGYAETDDELALQVRFDGPGLQGALAEREIALWPLDARPRTLAWVAVERNGTRELLGGGARAELEAALRRAGEVAGLGLLFPLMDLEDQRAVSSSDVWGAFRAPIVRASRRYDAEAVLVGRVSQRGGRWQSRWVLFWDGDSAEWTGQGEDVRGALASAMETGAADLARRYAAVPDPDSVAGMTLRVRGVNSLEAYGRVENYLRGLRDVEAVDVLRLGNDGAVDFRVRYQGRAERTVERIRGSRLLADDAARAASGETGEAQDGPVEGPRPDYIFRFTPS